MRIRPSTHKLFIAIILLISALLALVGLVPDWASGVLTGTDLILAAAGILTWNVAAIQAVGVVNQARSREIARETTQAPPADEKQQLIRGSTHSAINSSLHVAASSMFVGYSGRKLVLPSPGLSPIMLFMGSCLWFNIGATGLIQASIERNLEDNPERRVNPFGIRPSGYEYFNQNQILTAGALYLISACTDLAINPYFLLSDALWMIAGIYGTQQAYEALGITPPPNPSVQLQRPVIVIHTIEVAPKPSDVKITVIDEKNEVPKAVNTQVKMAK